MSSLSPKMLPGLSQLQFRDYKYLAESTNYKLRVQILKAVRTYQVRKMLKRVIKERV